jgi:hypothetical protein
MRHGCRKLGRDDHDAIQKFIAEAPRYATILMRGPARDIDTFKGWWKGALMGGIPEALLCVEGTTSHLYGANREAVEEMANNIVSLQKMGPASVPKTHQITGVSVSLDPFWGTLKALHHTLVHDRERDLMAATDPGKAPKSSVTVEPATQADFKLVYEFSADQTVAQWGWDPRRISPDSHQARCRRVIDDGRQLIGKDGGRPVFLAELVPIDEDTVLLDRIFVPQGLRLRKRMASCLIGAVRASKKYGNETLFFAEKNDEKMGKALALTEFESKATYRLVVFRR